MTFGRFCLNVKETKRDPSNLGYFCWTKYGGAGKVTCVIMLYTPHDRSSGDTKGRTMWDQHKTHYESQGMLDKDPCDALFGDLVEKIIQRKREDSKVVLAGDFSEDVYKGKLVQRLAEEGMHMSEQMQVTVGLKIRTSYTQQGFQSSLWHLCNDRDSVCDS